jgi:hypothetical protein
MVPFTFDLPGEMIFPGCTFLGTVSSPGEFGGGVDLRGELIGEGEIKCLK